MSPVTVSPKALRVDAQRNYDALLAAGKSVLARLGADAPLDEIARQAGVGRGTFYRHFPTREHLYVAIMQERLDLLDERARELADAPDAWEAVVEWLRLWDRSAAEYSGLAARVSAGLAEEGSHVATACEPVKKNFAILFERAQNEGTVRSDITAVQVLTLVAALPEQPVPGKTQNLYLDIVLDGLRP
jgi:AcrR family transcriptional regulator